MAVHQIEADFAVMRPRQADQTFVAAFAQPCLFQLRQAAFFLTGEGAGEQFAQAQIAVVVFNQQKGAEGCVGAVGIFDAYVCADDGFDARSAAGFVEFHQAEPVHQVADAECGQTFRQGFFYQGLQAHRAVGDGVFGMQAQRDVNGIGHGRDFAERFQTASGGAVGRNKYRAYCNREAV